MIEAEIDNGYGDTTIKDGVVMRSKTNNIRRATQDLDMDFIRYSLANDSIEMFIRKLNCLFPYLFQQPVRFML